MHISMRWGAASKCSETLGGWPLSANWQRKLVEHTARFQPSVVIFSPPVLHFQTACGKAKSVIGSAGERKLCEPTQVSAALADYIRFMARRVASPVGARPRLRLREVGGRQ